MLHEHAEILGIFKTHTLEAIFEVMIVVVNHREGQKQLEKIVLHLNSTVARQPIYDTALKSSLSLLQAIQWESRILVHFYCICNRIKTLRSWRKLRKPVFWNFSAINPWQKFARCQNLQQTWWCRHCLNCSSIQVTYISLRHAERAIH